MDWSTATESAPPSGASPVAPLAANATSRRWQIIALQLRAGREPCFRTERRHRCPERDCAYRAECRAMRADWQR